MPPIHEGQTFPNLHIFKDALREWAIERNWTPHILDSDSHRVRAGCRSAPDCPFRIRANYSAKRENAKVTTVDDVHNCEPLRVGDTLLHQPIRRAETGKLRFLLDAVPNLMNVTVDTSRHEIIKVVEQKYGQKIPVRQAQKVKAGLVDRVRGPCRQCHQSGHTRRTCPQLQDPPRGLMGGTTGSQDGNDTFGDGGIDTDFDQTQAPPSHLRPRPLILAEETNRAQDGETIDPNLRNGTPHLQNGGILPPPRIVEQHTRAPSQSIPARISTTQVITPVETRLQATRMMEEAGRLMKEAARLTDEAVRLNASVAHL